MFPESHSHAFAVTAYQAAWLKRYHPLEFFVALMNNQPMGFYPLETLKQDARRFGVPFANPCVNASEAKCAPRWRGAPGAGHGAGRGGRVGAADRAREGASRPVFGRGRPGAPDWAAPQALTSLVMAGAFDGPSPTAGRRSGMPACTRGPRAADRPCCPCLWTRACPDSTTSRTKKRWPASTPPWAYTPGAT